MPHMISVDRNNAVWITDVGRHQALQFTASGKLLQEVGVEATPGHDTEHLCKPTQVGVWGGCAAAVVSSRLEEHSALRHIRLLLLAALCIFPCPPNASALMWAALFAQDLCCSALV